MNALLAEKRSSFSGLRVFAYPSKLRGSNYLVHEVLLGVAALAVDDEGVRRQTPYGGIASRAHI